MLTRLRLYSIVILFLLSVPAGADEEISLSAGLDKSEIPFEGTVVLDVKIKWQGDISRYAFEVLPLPETENLKVLGTSSAISSFEENNREYTSRTFKYTLQPTGSGTGIIKPIALQCISMPDSIPHELTTQQLHVIIAEPLPEPEEGSLFLYFIIPIAIIAAAVVIVILKKRTKREVIPVRTAEETFLEELADIRRGNQSDRTQFFTRLHKALTEYIETKYNIMTAGRTAPDILAELEKDDISINEKEKISAWLQRAEKEKYAPFGGEPGDLIRLITELENHFAKNDMSDRSEAK